MTSPLSHVYHFGPFRLDPAARELWRDGALLEVPRLVFGALVLLVENRDRAVSRNELVEAVWGRSYVEGVLVTQIIMRLRRLIGDSSQRPRYIRAVPGFGYRWIADTEVLPGAETAPQIPGAGADATFLSGWWRGWRLPAVFALAALVAVIVYLALVREPEPLPHAAGDVIAVLPLEVRDAEDMEFGWVRLGAMDLIASRLRDAGLPVPPSDGVVSAMHAVADVSRAEQSPALRRTLGARVLVEGVARHEQGQWTVELTATAAGGERRRVVAGPDEIIPAAGRAADRLLAALGQQVPSGDEPDEPLSELLQRARAATLTLELDTARAILSEAPPALRQAPELRHELAWVELHSGAVEAAAAITTALLEDPAIAERPRMRARAWIVHANVVMAEAGDWGVGEPYFDAAIEVLDGLLWAPELGIALAQRGGSRNARHEFDAAARDLGRARTLFEVIGDRLGVARVHNYFGNLELERRRPADALPHLQASLDVYQSFGHVNGMRANLYSMVRAQSQLLRWPDALAASERHWALREQVHAPALRASFRWVRAQVLTRVGRLEQAAALVDRPGPAEAVDAPFVVARREVLARAELAWQRGAAEQVVEVVARALDQWPDNVGAVIQSAHDAAYLMLLYQRAAIASGRPLSATAVAPVISGIDNEPAYRVAAAEWAVHRGDHDTAERQFQAALAEAERQGVPATLVLVADAHARWLLSRDRVSEALSLAGRVVDWTEHDYDAALLQVMALHASGHEAAWADALARAERLAGERQIAEELRQPPVSD